MSTTTILTKQSKTGAEIEIALTAHGTLIATVGTLTERAQATRPLSARNAQALGLPGGASIGRIAVSATEAETIRAAQAKIRYEDGARRQNTCEAEGHRWEFDGVVGDAHGMYVCRRCSVRTHFGGGARA